MRNSIFVKRSTTILVCIGWSVVIAAASAVMVFSPNLATESLNAQGYTDVSVSRMWTISPTTVDRFLYCTKSARFEFAAKKNGVDVTGEVCYSLHYGAKVV